MTTIQFAVLITMGAVAGAVLVHYQFYRTGVSDVQTGVEQVSVPGVNKDSASVSRVRISGHPAPPSGISTGRWAGYTETMRTIGGTTYRLLVADTPQKHSRGLMDITDLDEYDGMIFLFPTREPRTFWNMNTLIRLDLLWMNGDEIVGRSELPSITESKEVVTVSSPAPVDTVIELPAARRL